MGEIDGGGLGGPLTHKEHLRGVSLPVTSILSGGEKGMERERGGRGRERRGGEGRGRGGEGIRWVCGGGWSVEVEIEVCDPLCVRLRCNKF